MIDSIMTLQKAIDLESMIPNICYFCQWKLCPHLQWHGPRSDQKSPNFLNVNWAEIANHPITAKTPSETNSRNIEKQLKQLQIDEESCKLSEQIGVCAQAPTETLDDFAVLLVW